METPEEFLMKYGICSDTTIGIEGDKKLTELLKEYASQDLRIHAARVEIQWFASKMEEKLALNNHKTGWKDCGVDVLIYRMQEEIDELENGWWKRKNDFGRSAGEGFMFVPTNEELIKECADVANFAMMVADVLKEVQK